MNKIVQLGRILAHPRELYLALSGLGVRLGGEDTFGGLTDAETRALVDWVRAAKVRTFVEIGTLFGFTAAAIARQTAAQVVAVDNFSWNPFGLRSDEHERFTRRVLADTPVELVRADAREYLMSLGGTEGLAVFLDGDHRYEAVKAELEILMAKGVRLIAGHDFGDPRFGVTQAVRETLGAPDGICGRIYFKQI